MLTAKIKREIGTANKDDHQRNKTMGMLSIVMLWLMPILNSATAPKPKLNWTCPENWYVVETQAPEDFTNTVPIPGRKGWWYACDSDWNYLDESDLYGRDVYAVIEGKITPPVRGWSFKWQPLLEFDGAIDYDEYLITASKAGKPDQFWHVSIRSGTEDETEQNLYEIRIKRVKSADEDWNHNFWWDKGEWSGERGKSKHWVPYADDPKSGVCSENDFSTSPVTREECFRKDQ